MEVLERVDARLQAHSPKSPAAFPPKLRLAVGYDFTAPKRPDPVATPQVVPTRPALKAADRAELLALKGWVHGRFRDFEQAHRAVDEAIALSPENYWLHVQRSAVLEFEDRYEEALEVARAAWRMAPGRPTAVMQLVDCLIHDGRDAEAIALLEDAHEKGESAGFAERLVHLYSEREDHQNALRSLDEHDRRSPLLDKHGRQWSLRRRADFLYLAGDIEGTLACCDQLPDGYHRSIAKNLRLPGALERGRRRLDVPFVRQHNMTCAPATLAALAAYWGFQFDHLAISDAICYNGTPWHKERTWAEANGFYAAEFRLTREILVALIDRGVPFTLCTEAVTSSHLQACIGYDERQGVVLLRDPTERHFGEIIFDGLLEGHPVQGPRCMLLLPHAERGRLAGLTLPDQSLYDAYHDLSLALDAHERQRARVALDRMPEGKPMTLWAELRIARYDRNPAAEQAVTDRLLERFPDHAPLRYSRLGIVQRMNDFARERSLVREELQKKECDPVFYSEMGELLLRDARHLPLADYYLRKAVRLRSGTAQVYGSLAYCRWKERRFEDCARYRRVAACLEEAWEWSSAAYAEVCRAKGQPEEGLAFLRRRVETLGTKDTGPWQTLAKELEMQGRTEEAVALLERAMSAHPDDGALQLAVGRRFTVWGRQKEGEALMQCARGRVREADWHYEMAWISGFYGRREESIGHWRAYLELEPYAMSAYHAIARLLAEEGGAERAVRYLEEVTTRHPHHPELWSLKAEWERGQNGPQAAIISLEKARALDPDAIWVLRELAIQRFQSGDHEGALADAREALGKDPQQAASHRILGVIHEERREMDDARACFRRALALDIDDTATATALVRLATEPAQRRAALEEIEREMRRQVSNGDIVPEYCELAYQHLEPTVLLGQLRGFCAERPDLWQTWAAFVQQALKMDLLEEAREAAQTLTARFPLLPRAWVELAQVHRSAGAHEEEVNALQRAVALSPAWDWAARLLSAALERLERYDEALDVLRRALHHEPLAGQNHGCLADLLWKLGRRAEAFDTLLEGMRHCPSYGWGWPTLTGWSRELKREEEVVAVLETHRDRRGHLPAWWVQVSDVLHELDRSQAGLDALETGLQRHPDHPELLEQKAFLLGALHRFEPALAICRETLARYPDLRTLSGRQAWLLMQAGQPNEAIRKMTALVERHPDYLWAIRQLCGWLEERKRWAELRDLAQAWVRQEPHSAVAYGNLGEAQKELGQRGAAQQAFQKAFDLDPEYDYAGRHLLSFQIQDKAFEAAAQTLRTLEHYVPSATIAADAVELAIGKRDREEAGRAAEALLAREDATAPLLGWMQELFAEPNWLADWWKRLDAAATGTALPSPVVLEAWIRSLPSRKALKRGAKRLEALPQEADDLKAAGWIALLEVAEEGDARLVRRWLRRHGTWLRSRNDLWNAAGSALISIDDHKAARAWLADWESRIDDTSPDALFNYGVAVEALEGWHPAIPVWERSIQRYPGAFQAPSLRAMIALYHAVENRMEEARAVGGEVEAERLNEYYAACFALYQSIIATIDGKEEAGREHYESALRTYNALPYEQSARTFFAGTQRALARTLPWAKGRAGRVRRRWGCYTGTGLTRLGRWWWLIVLLILAAMRALEKGLTLNW